MTLLLTEHDDAQGLPLAVPSLEDEHPWLRLVYAATIVATIVVSMLLTGCGGGDPEPELPLAEDGTRTTQPIDCVIHPEKCE